MRNLAVEWGPSNVRVNCIAPGLVQTDFAKYLWENPELLKQVTEPAPLKRIGQPDEIAGTAVQVQQPCVSLCDWPDPCGGRWIDDCLVSVTTGSRI